MRLSKISAAVLAASVTFGGAALAFADDVMPADPTIEADATTTTVEDPAPTTTAEGTEPTTTTTVAEGDGEADGDGTKVHPDNHGKAVSETAHNTPPGPGHGKAVSEVARSKAGKAAKAQKPKKDATTTTTTTE